MSARTKTKNKSVLLRILIVAFCAYMLVSIYSLITELSDSKNALAEIKTEIDATASRIEESKNLLENSAEEELVEKAAREKLDYVYPNEQVFVDISGN